jgi:hypothetical protein
MNPDAISRSDQAVTHGPDAISRPGQAVTHGPEAILRPGQAVTHEHHVLHTTYPCQYRKDATHYIRPTLAVTRRPVALHIKGL